MRQNEIAAPTNKDTEPAPKWIRFLLARLEKEPCNFKLLLLERKMFESKKVLAKLRTKGKNKTIRESNILLQLGNKTMFKFFIQWLVLWSFILVCIENDLLQYTSYKSLSLALYIEFM